MQICVNPQRLGEKVTDILERMHTEENVKIKDLKIEHEKLVQKLQNIKESDQDRISGSRFEDLGPQRMQEKLKYLERIIHTRISLPTRIHIVSCAEDLRGVKKFQQSLESKLSETEERPFPRLWYRFLTAIQERKEKLLHWEQAILIFKDVMEEMKQSMISQQGSAESSLEVILKYLHSTGEIVWYYENPKLKGIVFHRPDTLVEMLRAVFRHDFEKVVTYDDRLGRISNINQNKFNMMKSDFLSQGLMTLELLHYCLLHFQLSIEAKDMFVDLMLKFDLCYEVPKMAGAPATLASSRVLRFPWFLSMDVPENVGLSWPERAPSDVVEMKIQFHFPKKLPPNVFEKLSARLQSHVLKREDWKDGTLAQRNKTKILVTRSKISGGNNIDVTMSVRGSDLQELWFLLKNARIDLLGLLQEWPFAQFEQNLYCSHCILRGDDDPFIYPAEVLDMTCPKGIYRINCQKEKNDMVPACFVYPLDSEFQDDIGEHIKVVNEFLQGLMDTIDGAGLLTDMGLSYVASKLGAEWSLVALNLGLSQPEIEQIQLDNPYQTVKQTTTSLVRWRDRQNNGSEDDILNILLKTLKDCDRGDLVKELQEKYGIADVGQ
ncbi:hypothetical protein KUTeg_001704 [Tegillarca granosa]|uniref:Death domain-containing protein n=1 Tax=Tegillarca granosa TaxID=220873 RepID=A0ABQ9FTQ5_TEGGR|nr:hypothetical protein KUTeg_001704 [Tegillarca granosa]